MLARTVIALAGLVSVHCTYWPVPVSVTARRPDDSACSVV
jgi:hypothetical protein